MKRYFKYGIGVSLPSILVLAFLWWVYDLFTKLTKTILPSSMTYKWWFPFVVLVGMVIILFLIGLITSLIKPVRWLIEQIEKRLIKRIPVVRTIYEFGSEVVEALLNDIKTGNKKVVKVEAFGSKMYGILMDEENKTVFAPTAPNPSNGFMFVDAVYEIADMTSMGVFKFVTSLGTILEKKKITGVK